MRRTTLRIEMRFWTLHCRLGYQDCFGWEGWSAGLAACCCAVEEAKWQRDGQGTGWECWDYFWGRSVSRISASWNQNCLGVGLQEVAMVAGSLSVGWKDLLSLLTDQVLKLNPVNRFRTPAAPPSWAPMPLRSHAPSAMPVEISSWR